MENIPILNIFDCCENNDVKGLLTILEKNDFDINIQNGGDKNTPLHIAVLNNSRECLDILIQHRANVNIKNNYGKTSLHAAAWKQSKEMIKILIENGGNINIKSQYGITPLIDAVDCNALECVEFLLQCGGDPNDKDDNGFTCFTLCSNK